MATLDDGIEWVVRGDHALSGVYRGKEEVERLWQQVGDKDFRTEPREFIAEGDKVVVLTTYRSAMTRARPST